MLLKCCRFLILISFFTTCSFGISDTQYINFSTKDNQHKILIKIEDKMKETNQRLNLLEQMVPDLENNIKRDLHSLRNSILDKLEEYMDSKLKSLAIDFSEKLKQNRNCNLDNSDKKTLEKFEENINFKLDNLAKNIPKEIDRNVYCKSNDLKKIIDLENSLNRKLDTLDSKIPSLENNINLKLDILAKNISKELEILKKVTDTKNNKTPQSSGTENKFPEKCYVTSKIPGGIKLPCKETSLGPHSYTPYYSMDSETPNSHSTLRRNSTGHLTFFEMHFSIEADEHVGIRVSDTTKDGSGLLYNIEIGRESNQNTILYQWAKNEWKTIQHVQTPNILSSSQIRAFYIKIDDGNLEFGKEGYNSPLISHDDARLSLANYFRFNYWGNSAKAKICYDCPAPSEELSCKKTSVSRHSFTPYYLIDDEIRDNATLIRNSTGHLTYFKMHFAIEANEDVDILLSDSTKDGSESIILYWLEIGQTSNQHTLLHLWNNGFKRVVQVHTPNILSSTQFRAFYIKISDGKLEFGKEGHTPFITHHNAGLGLVNYFRFNYWGKLAEAKIRYVCPAPAEGSL